MNQCYHITFDIDWAPDDSIKLCLDMLSRSSLKATFFTTHHTDMNQEIILQGHELGIHPNFLSGSTHGEDVLEIVETCLGFAPEARYMRTHSLYQSSRLLYEVFGSFPQLTTDLSLFMHRARHAQRCTWSFDGVSFDRILYNWEDDAQFYDPNYDYSRAKFFGEVTIYDFHPIHVDLNSRELTPYGRLRELLGSRRLFTASSNELESCRNPGQGTCDFLGSIIDSAAQPINLEDVE